MERCVLVLRNFLDLSVKLRGGCLIDTAGLCHTQLTNSLQDAQYTYSIHISRKLRAIERHLHMALCSKVIYFIGLNFSNNSKDTH